MSENPEKRNKDSRETLKGDIEQDRPLDKQDPTEPVTVEGTGAGTAKGKAAEANQGL